MLTQEQREEIAAVKIAMICTPLVSQEDLITFDDLALVQEELKLNTPTPKYKQLLKAPRVLFSVYQ